MLTFFRSKKSANLSEKTLERIKQEIDYLKTVNLQEGIFFKTKEFDFAYYINIIIDKRILELESSNNETNNNIPDYITFLFILDINYPESPPKVLSKTNFSVPNLMDGRDLFYEICKNYDDKTNIYYIANEIPKFINKVINSKVYNFYGTFHVGALYDMKNFSNMLVNDFVCKEEKEDEPPTNNNNNTDNNNSNNNNNNYVLKTLILSDDAMILFEILENNIGKIEFWATLYSLTELQVNKMTKIASMSFFNDENNSEKKLNLQIENILFFREALVKRMSTLKVKTESKRLIKGQNAEKRLTDKEIGLMSIPDVIKNINNLVTKIKNNEVNYYIVNTFMKLVGRAIEHFSSIQDDRNGVYLNLMKEILSIESVQKVAQDLN